MLASHLSVTQNLQNALIENAFFLLYVTAGLLFFWFLSVEDNNEQNASISFSIFHVCIMKCTTKHFPF